ncbi:MAG TPA: NADH-quinone oxidoreductase subunit J [Chitinophagaceae bacterium]|nr:NADH-quinone oxidoreductase subunit J [Chitinophagaceae bacterium]
MSASAVMFYILAAFILGTGLLAVTTKKIFRSAVWLLFSLIGIAGLYFWLQMEFIAAVQIIVYVGGIVVLIIFSIFLTQQSGKEMPRPPVTRAVFAALSALFGFAFTYFLIEQYTYTPTTNAAVETSIANIGTQMLDAETTGYVLPLEVVSILLLAAMIGCIVIAMKVKPADK